jgi:VWFA-related protein
MQSPTSERGEHGRANPVPAAGPHGTRRALPGAVSTETSASRGRRASRLALALILFASLLPAPGVVRGLRGQPEDTPADPLLWPEPERAFLQDGPGLLLPESERQRLTAADPASRAALIREFLGRDPIPGTAQNELAEGIARRQRLAAEFLSPRDVRAQLLFLNGKPADRQKIDCGTAFRPLEIWTYRAAPAAGAPADAKPREGKAIVFEPAAGEPWRMWNLFDSKRALYSDQMGYWLDQWEEAGRGFGVRRFDLQVCKETRLVDAATGIQGIAGGRRGRGGLGSGERKSYAGNPYGLRPWAAPGEREGFLDPPRDLARWAHEAAATSVPAAPPALATGALDLQFPERDGQRIVVRALLRLADAARLKPVTNELGKPELTLIAEGVVERDGHVFDEVRVRYHLPVPRPGPHGETEPVDLALDRSLRPGGLFLLRLRVRDEGSGAEARLARGFMVPREPIAPPPSARAAATGQPLAPTIGTSPDSLTLLPPDTDVILGLWRTEALVTGKRIAKVVFSVDGKQQLTRTAPPYTAEVRLAQFPTEQVVRAEGFDDKGRSVAVDEVVVNQPRGGFRVTILDPPRGQHAGRVNARAEVSVPEERRVDSVEFRVNDKPVATLTRPPWETSITVPQEETVYLSVAAKLDDGSRAEDTRFLRSPSYLEEVNVDLVEFYVAVTDSAGELVRGLTPKDFQVLDRGKPQSIAKFELVENLPLTLGLMIDTSGSMASSLAEAERAAAGFLSKVVKPKDRCFALSFSGRPVLRMPLTDDVEAVAHSLDAMQAVGSTALHDALVHSLYYFRGSHGQRALVILSDGDDNSSELSFKDAMEYAKRSGVAVYTIGLNVPITSVGIRSKLSSLSDETGGKVFFIGHATELANVYGRIEAELRSRYLVAFNADRTAGDKSFHPVEVKVSRGLRTRTARGYYP